MAIDYANLATVAATLIGDNGRDVTIRRRPPTVPDPAKPWEPAAVATTPGADNVTAKAVNVALTSAQRLQTTLEANMSRFLISYVGGLAELDPGWEILDGADVYQVRTVDLVKPGATSIYFDVMAET